MKRIISFFLATVLAAVLFAACSGGESISTGLGVTTNIIKSVASVNGEDGTVQVDSVAAAVTLDSNGVIIKLSIDAPQTRVVFNREGIITSGISGEVQSKREKGDSYGMKEISGIGKEWHEQIAAFEDWAVGKTVDEVIGLKTKRVDDARQHVPDIPELTSSVTITVGDYQKAIGKAAANAKTAKASKAFMTGLGIVTRASGSKNATAEAEGRAQVDSMFAVVTVNGKGNIVACSIDAVEAVAALTSAGEINTDLTAEIKTSKELSGDYGLQAAAFSDWAVGKTISEIKKATPPSAGIDAGDFITAVEKAVANAK